MKTPLRILCVFATLREAFFRLMQLDNLAIYLFVFLISPFNMNPHTFNPALSKATLDALF